MSFILGLTVGVFTSLSLGYVLSLVKERGVVPFTDKELDNVEVAE